MACAVPARRVSTIAWLPLFVLFSVGFDPVLVPAVIRPAKEQHSFSLDIHHDQLEGLLLQFHPCLIIDT